ncbi:MAG: hypothetical protein CMF75_08365 [Maricaulis sp.]|nr:hypothetical protein [Maricaulis sp.]
MSAREDHPVMPLVVRADLVTLRPGHAPALDALRRALDDYDREAVRAAAEAWQLPAFDALEAMAHTVLRGPSDDLPGRDRMAEILSAAVKLALRAVNVTRHEINDRREALMNEELPL